MEYAGAVLMEKIKICFIFLLVCVPFNSQAEIYKWTDSSGTIHYDDKPPLQNKKQLMNIREQHNSVQGVSGDRLKRQKKLLDAMDEDRKLKKDETAKKKKKKAQLKKQCNNARDSLKGYLRSSYVYNLDKDGNRVVLPSSARDNVIARLRKRIETSCSN